MIQFNNKIDVIIPAYNVPSNILFRCLASIAFQDIAKDLDVTIIDDASTEQNYQEVIKPFKEILNIQIFRLDSNKGPGVARQYGIDNTSNEFITFIDADDTLNGPFALKALLDGLKADNGINQVCAGVFDEIYPPDYTNNEIIPHIKSHERDLIWLFGKIYRRAFLEKYNIRFHSSSRSNEDNGFNTICRLHASPEERIKFIPIHVYYWHMNLNSITCRNNFEYSFNSGKNNCFYGYIENMIYAIKEARKYTPNNNNIDTWTLDCMFYIYIYYLECLNVSPQDAEENLKWCKLYYDSVYRELEDEIPKDVLAEFHNEAMKQAYLEDKFLDFIPELNFFEFINKLR